MVWDITQPADVELVKIADTFREMKTDIGATFLKIADVATYLSVADGRYKVGSFTADAGIQSTSVITGVGFQPKYVIFFAVLVGTKGICWGLDNPNSSTNDIFLRTQFASVDEGYTLSYTSYNEGKYPRLSIRMDYHATGIFITSGGRISSVNADGFSFNWSFNISDAAPITVGYLAIR